MPDLKGDPTPAEAAVTLREYAISRDAPEHVTAAIAIMLDHVVRLEQTLDLIGAGHESAMRAKPDNAIHLVALKTMRQLSDPARPGRRKGGGKTQ